MISFDSFEISRDDVARYDALLSHMGQRCDANETMLLAKQLEFVKAQAYEKKYPGFRALDFIPLASGTPNAAAVISFKIWDAAGHAKVIDDYGTDLPSVSAFVREASTKVTGVGTSYGYSIQDIRAAQFAGVALDPTLAKAARRHVEHTFDEVAAKGLPSKGMPGFINHPNVALVAPDHGAWATGPKSAVQVLADMRKLAKSIVVDSKGVHKPDTMILPVGLYELISATEAGANLNETVLSLFLKTNPHIKNVDSWYHLDTAGADGGNRIVCYQRDAEIIELEIPQPFEQFPPEARGLMFSIACHGRVGGCVLRYPLGMRYMDGC